VGLYVGPFALVAPAAVLAGSLMVNVAPAVHLVASCFATGGAAGGRAGGRAGGGVGGMRAACCLSSGA
jgi:hypothetical protein